MKATIERFLKQESASGILLIVAAASALIIANSPLHHAYEHLLHLPFQLRLGSLDINMGISHWINDGLMALFFLVIGLEVKRELMEGALANREKATLPAIAAVGGMVVPALVYAAFNYDNPETIKGWAIPAATDIAFALGIMALLGKRVPAALKVFLLALAISDDLGVIVIIALFYTSELSTVALYVASGAVAAMFVLNRFKVGSDAAYLALGAVLWVALLKSGIHATLAGVITGLMIPLYDKEGFSPLKQLEHDLHTATAFIILPIFAFANAGVNLSGFSFSDLTQVVPLGIFFGLVLGKPLGIFGISWLAIKMNIAKLPEGTNLGQLFATAMLCGIGFTMSIFITSLAFVDETLMAFADESQPYGTQARIAILLASMIAAVMGYFLLKFTTVKAVKS